MSPWMLPWFIPLNGYDDMFDYKLETGLMLEPAATGNTKIYYIVSIRKSISLIYCFELIKEYSVKFHDRSIRIECM